MDSALIIFLRNPVLGKVKTRLAKELGEQTALEVYTKLLSHTHTITTNVAADKYIFYADYINENDLWQNYLYYKELQNGGNLGERMKGAFELLFKKGYKRIVIIGSDCYELSSGLIQEAIDQLINLQIVIGPATDGGYYLLGMNTFIGDVFENKQWSTETVFEKTINDITSLGCSYYLLPQLNDVDNKNDLKKFPELLSLPSHTNL